jgi:Tol biopolymer transport system component
MTADTRPDGRLPEILEELYLGRIPDYETEVVAGAVRHRQRAAWTFPGRWLPMADIANRPTFAPALPWRTIGLALVLIAVTVAFAVAIAGSRQSRVPSPFGVARNGLVAYSSDGDVFAADPQTGVITPLVTSPAQELDPAFAPDGTDLAFGRVVDGTTPAEEDIVVAKADGSDQRVVTLQPIAMEGLRFEWAPDSRHLILTTANDAQILLLDTATRAQPDVLATDASLYLRPFQPPDGNRILVSRQHLGQTQLIVLDLATKQETVIAERGRTNDLGAARWSGDGTKVVYNASPDTDLDSQRLFVVNADGTGTTQITHEPGVWYDIDATWSPDGRRIAFTRYQRGDGNVWDVRPTGIYDVATGTVTEVGPLPRDVRAQYPEDQQTSASAGEGFAVEWSPDARSLIAFTSEADGHPILIDADTGTWRALGPSTAPQTPFGAWQRTAP